MTLVVCNLNFVLWDPSETPPPPPPIICLNGDFRAPFMYVFRHNCCYRTVAVAVITRSTSTICLRNSTLNHVDPLSVDGIHIVKDKHVT